MTTLSPSAFSNSPIKYSFYYISYVEHLRAKVGTVHIPDEFFQTEFGRATSTVMTSEGHILQPSSQLHFHACETCGVLYHKLHPDTEVCYAFFQALTKDTDYVNTVHFVIMFCSEECLTLFVLSDKGHEIPHACKDVFLPF